MNFGIRNKVALVTAASQGLGKASALALAGEGCRVAICSRSKRSIEATASEIAESTGARVIPVVADVTKPADIDRLIRKVRSVFGTIHILVNNVGGPPTGNLLTMPEKEWKRGVDLLLLSAVRIMRRVLPLMINQRWGRIITITSITAKQPIDDLLISSTLRPGLRGLTKVLSNQHASKNITVNAICPGMILTARQEELMKARSSAGSLTLKEYMRKAAVDIPTGRFGTPDEVGNVIAFLASQQASYINGVSLLVDGGMAKGI